MRTEVALQDLGEGITEAFVVEWLVAVGDHVDEGSPIVEMMTDKANFEIEAPMSGTITELKFEPEARVEVGQIVAIIDSGTG